MGSSSEARELDHYDVVKQAANATTLTELKQARKDLIAYTREYGHDPLVQKAGEQVETLMISQAKKNGMYVGDYGRLK